MSAARCQVLALAFGIAATKCACEDLNNSTAQGFAVNQGHLRGNSLNVTANVNGSMPENQTSLSNSTVEAQGWPCFWWCGRGDIRRFSLVSKPNLCLSHEDNWFWTNKIRVANCDHGSHQRWEVNLLETVGNAQFSEIKSYHKNDCLSSEPTWFSWGNVKGTLRGCNRGSHQEWTHMLGGLLKSKDGKCLEYNEGDSYVYMRDCNSWTFEQKWTVLDGQ